jgi:hypothetical protein
MVSSETAAATECNEFLEYLERFSPLTKDGLLPKTDVLLAKLRTAVRRQDMRLFPFHEANENKVIQQLAEAAGLSSQPVAKVAALSGEVAQTLFLILLSVINNVALRGPSRTCKGAVFKHTNVQADLRKL